MKQLVIGDIVSRAWNLAVKHWPIFVLFSVVSSLVSGLGVSLDPVAYTEMLSVNDPQAQLELLSEALSMNYPLMTIGFLLSVYLSYVVLNLYVNAYKNGRPYNSFGEAFKVDVNQLAIYFCVTFVYAIVVALGAMLCILPGIWLGVRLWYAPLQAATQGASFGEAFTRSWQMTQNHFWQLFLLGLTQVGIALLGFCACFVGIYFAEVLIEFTLIVSFFILLPEEPESAAGFSAETTDYIEVK